MRLRLALLLLSLTLGGCLRPERFVAALEQRQAESCVYLAGFVGPFVFFTSVTATGGMTVEACHAQRP